MPFSFFSPYLALHFLVSPISYGRSSSIAVRVSLILSKTKAILIPVFDYQLSSLVDQLNLNGPRGRSKNDLGRDPPLLLALPQPLWPELGFVPPGGCRIRS